tara:strand:- start:811 stop:1269 length:459 start_codon:yes stop_codon:yes gene_type:complete
MTTMMPNIFGNYGPDPMLQQSPQGLESILMPLQGIQGPLQQIVSEMPGQINSYVDEEIQRRMDEMKTTPSPTPTPTDPVGPPQDPFQPPMPGPFPFPKDLGSMPVFGGPAKSGGIFGGLPPFLLDRLRGRQRFGQGSYQIPRPIAGLPSIFG